MIPSRAPRGFTVCALLAALATSPAGGQSPVATTSQGPAFPSGVELVTVDVVVLDKQGDPVEGLRAEDFSVEEDGRPQAITSFEAATLKESEAVPPSSRPRVSTNTAPAPRPERSFVIVFDDANISQFTTGPARAAVIEFIDRGLRPGDHVTLAPTAGGAWWSERLPEGREALVAFVKGLEGRRRPDTGTGRISDFEALQIQFGRDAQVLAQVARRYYENGLILDLPGTRDREIQQIRRDIGTDAGVALIRNKASEVWQQSVRRTRATLGTLERLAAAFASLRGRKTLLLVSDGFVHDASQPEFRELVRAARSANAAVYFVDARGLEGTLGSGGLPGGGAEFMNPVEERDTLAVLGNAAREADGARSVAIDTGGRIITSTNELAAGMQKIARESRSYYLLGYTSSNTKRDGKFRKIQVALKRPDVELRARRGYYAPSDDDRAARLGSDELQPAVRAALDAPFSTGTLPLRLTSYVLAPAAGGKRAVLLAADADLGALGLKAEADGRYSDVLETYLIVAPHAGGESVRQEKLMELSLPAEVHARLVQSWLPVFRDVELPPGAYQARLLLRSRKTGRLGSVRHEFTVDDAGGLSASTPILTDTLQPAGPQGPARPLPVARREFKSGGPLFYLFEVYQAGREAAGGAPRVTSSYVVHRGDGSVYASTQPRAIVPGPQGQVSQLLQLALKDAAPGDYEIQLTIQDDLAGKTLEIKDPFTVVQ
jgi:VWFA-related protein